MLIESLILMVEQKHEFDSKDLAYLNSFILFTEKKLKREMEIDEILALKLVDFILEGLFYTKIVKWGVFSRWLSSLYCPKRNSDLMTIGKTHPTLVNWLL